MSLFLRVIASFFYDILILLALSLAISALFTGLLDVDFHLDSRFLIIFQVSLIMMIAGYFVLSWRYGGQTIGMKAWKLRVIKNDAALLSWQDAFRRLGAAVLSLFLLNMGWLGYLSPYRMSLTDRFSFTYIDYIG